MRALLEILVLGFRGRIVRRVTRLKDPRQILAFLAGIGYMGYFFLRPFLLGFGGRRHGWPGGGPMPIGIFAPSQYTPAIQLAIALGLAILVVGIWITTSSRPAFRFTEAEIHLLLPAPLTRRQILDFALLKQQAGVLVGAFVILVFTVFRSSASPAAALPRFFCYWGFLTLLDLHIKGISLWKARLTEIPAAAATWRRALAGSLAAAWVAAIAWGLWSAWKAAGVGGNLAASEIQKALLGFVGAAGAGVAGRALAPLLWLGGLVVGSGAVRVWGGVFLLALIALHYEWVVRSSASFEEASLERARRRALRGKRRNSWESLSRQKRTRVPFRLEAARAPELAITWKNLILRGRMPLAQLARRTLLGLAVLALAIAGLRAFDLSEVAAGGIGGSAMLLMAIMPLLAGNVLRNDLHADFQRLETLRAWPISGWRLILAEVLAPATALLWLELTAAGIVVAAALGAGLAGGAAAGDRSGLFRQLPPAVLQGASLPSALAAFLLALLMMSLTIGLFSIALMNLGILLFPGWVPLGYAVPRGTSMVGQNLVVSLGRLIGLVLGAIPPFLVAGLVFLLWNVLLSHPFRAWELPLLALIAALPFLFETYLMLRFAGAIWDRLDPSQEMLEPEG